jgi:hypothetical protein
MHLPGIELNLAQGNSFSYNTWLIKKQYKLTVFLIWIITQCFSRLVCKVPEKLVVSMILGDVSSITPHKIFEYGPVEAAYERRESYPEFYQRKLREQPL